MRDYPVSKTQSMVLEALGMTATGFGDAEKTFTRLGITVASKRQGRSSVPVITIQNRQQGAFNAYGEGETWDADFEDFDKSPIEQWIES